MLNYAFLFGIVALCWAQTPTPCESPAQWQGRRLRQELTGQSRMMMDKYTYDATNKRTRAVEEVMQGQEQQFFDTLTLYNENKQYIIDLRTKKCNVTTPPYPFSPVGVPPSSKFLFESEVGAAGIPNEHLTVTNWEGKFSDGVQYTTAVTSPSCLPVWFGAYADNQAFTVSYFDLVAGIPDPSVFIPPSNCNSL